MQQLKPTNYAHLKNIIKKFRQFTAKRAKKQLAGNTSKQCDLKPTT